MSFTSRVKDEVSTIDSNKEEQISELSALVRNISTYNNESIIITVENSKVARRIYTLIKDIYYINPIITDKDNSFNRSRLFSITIKEKVDLILKDLSVISNEGIYIDCIPDYILGSEEEIRAYLRGIFLGTGSVNDPKTSRYHLEFFIDNKIEAENVAKLLNGFDLNAKVILKDKKYMVYVKEAEKIGDFLRIISANQAVMYYEDIRIYRDHKNMTNRLNNMEQANIDKIIDSCNEQLKYIEIIKNNDCLSLLDNKTLEAIQYREKYPESSLQELSEIISLESEKKITKSGLNHRFRKIKDLAIKIDDLNKKKEENKKEEN